MSVESIPWALCHVNILFYGLMFVLLHRQKVCGACVAALMMFSIDLNIIVWCQPFARAVLVSFTMVIITLSSSLCLVPLCRLNSLLKRKHYERNLFK